MRKNFNINLILRVLGINFTILLILLLGPALLYRLYSNFKSKSFYLQSLTSDPRANYPTYSDKKFSIELFNELKKLPTIYKSFIGWRRARVQFKHINIAGKYNTRKSEGESLNNSVWFFGGSTMWGNGVSDSQTIPSHFNSLTDNLVYNFGETGWNSRQSLNQLINSVGDNHKPSSVIFYDGVNDIYDHCRSENQVLPIHSYERRLQEALSAFNNPSLKNTIIEFILSPYILLANRLDIQSIKVDSSVSRMFDCSTNQTKARSIAKHMVNNWHTAYLLSEANNFEFHAILQPTLFSTKTNSEYFVRTKSEVRRDNELQLQYNTVYPLILDEIKIKCKLDKKFCSSLINGTDWLDGIDNIFIDFCHLNSLGNKLIAKRFKLLLNR